MLPISQRDNTLYAGMETRSVLDQVPSKRGVAMHFCGPSSVRSDVDDDVHIVLTICPVLTYILLEQSVDVAINLFKVTFINEKVKFHLCLTYNFFCIG